MPTGRKSIKQIMEASVAFGECLRQVFSSPSSKHRFQYKLRQKQQDNLTSVVVALTELPKGSIFALTSVSSTKLTELNRLLRYRGYTLATVLTVDCTVSPTYTLISMYGNRLSVHSI